MSGAPKSLDREPFLSSAHWALVNRIATSEPFANSPRLRGLFLYLAERALQNPEASLSEQQVGVGMFHRAQGYDTASDTIVRVHASELRKRLKYYFLAEGRDEPTIVDLPRGSYLPIFRERDSAASNGSDQAGESSPALRVVEAANPKTSVAASSELRKSFWGLSKARQREFALAALLFFATLVCAWLAYENFRLQQQLPKTTPLVSRFWTQLFQNGGSTELIPPDFGATVISDLQARTISLEEYSNPNYASAPLAHVLPEGAAHHFITRLLNRGSIESTELAPLQALLRTTERYRVPFRIVSPRQAEIDPETPGNVILLGHGRGNPWAQLFEKDLNFKYQFDDATRKAMIINRSPLEGEKPIYAISLNGENYAVAACTRKKTGTVLLLFGANLRGSEGAVDLITREEALEQLFARLGLKAGDPIPNFEVLLEKKRDAQNYHIIASRVSVRDPLAR